MDKRVREVIGLVLMSILMLPWFLPYTIGDELHRKITEAKGEIQFIKYALEMYFMEHNNYPESLTELTKNDLLDREFLLDPWLRFYQYQPVVKKIETKIAAYKLSCNGPDRAGGTDDDILSDEIF